MRVVVARHAGACYGVNRALARVRAAAETSSRVFTLGPLIHNPKVVSDLAEQGISAVESLDELKADDVVVIRSHGVAPAVVDEALRRGLVVEDATCPYVSKVQRAAARLSDGGYHVIIVGEAGHPEVEGIRACVSGPVTVVSSAEDIPGSLPGRVGVVVQTTQSRQLLESVVTLLEKQVSDLVVRDTICFATQQRQESAAELSLQADVMVVIGGRNSGNTRRLFDICRDNCAWSYLIEGPAELDPAWFAGAGLVGVTAGASTPESQIREVVDVLGCLPGTGLR